MLNVVHGKELVVEYKKREIIDKINSFFGYNYLEKISLNLVHSEQKQTKKSFFKRKKNNDFDNAIKKISNSDLKKLMDKLIKAYNDKNNL